MPVTKVKHTRQDNKSNAVQPVDANIDLKDKEVLEPKIQKIQKSPSPPLIQKS